MCLMEVTAGEILRTQDAAYQRGQDVQDTRSLATVNVVLDGARSAVVPCWLLHAASAVECCMVSSGQLTGIDGTAAGRKRMIWGYDSGRRCAHRRALCRHAILTRIVISVHLPRWKGVVADHGWPVAYCASNKLHDLRATISQLLNADLYIAKEPERQRRSIAQRI